VIAIGLCPTSGYYNTAIGYTTSDKNTAIGKYKRLQKHSSRPIVVFCVASVLKYNSSPTAVLFISEYIKHSNRSNYLFAVDNC